MTVLQVNSRSIDQKSGEICAGQADLQPISFKSDRLLCYQPTRQTGSHVRLTSMLSKEHHLTIPLHDPLRIGTLAAILADVATHHAMTREALIIRLFGK